MGNKFDNTVTLKEARRILFLMQNQEQQVILLHRGVTISGTAKDVKSFLFDMDQSLTVEFVGWSNMEIKINRVKGNEI